ncbi:hypothetical protein [Flagellimonas flava]|uniref:hypothetical protein n=1 Tax=Flagellimonas flava TaxID=570519 RepID=UPI003D662E57
MKNPKPLALALTLFTFSFGLLTSVSCKKDDPCVEKTWYKDTDMDDEGDPANTKEACEQPNGYVANSNDPDDTNDQITSDCEQLTYYADEDEDGYGDPNNSITQCSGLDTPTGYVEDNTDCDVSNADNYPGSEYMVYLDSDEDGLGNPKVSQSIAGCEPIPVGYVLDNTDCNDPVGPFIASEWIGNYNVERTEYHDWGLNSKTEFDSCYIEIVEGEPNTLKLIGFWSGGYPDYTLIINIDPCNQMATWDESIAIGYYPHDPYKGNVHWERTDKGGYAANDIIMDPENDYGWCFLDYTNKTIELYGAATIPEHNTWFKDYKCVLSLIED